jgi:hypothetical protein
MLMTAELVVLEERRSIPVGVGRVPGVKMARHMEELRKRRPMEPQG